MAKARRTTRTAGAVDWEQLGKEPLPHTRWRMLQSTTTLQTLEIFGYSIDDVKGPWVGYDRKHLHEAPCTHCGRRQFSEWGVIGPTANRFHLCPGNLGADSMGNVVPCPYDGLRNDANEHVCDGIPSMSYHGVSRWTSLSGWKEIEYG